VKPEGALWQSLRAEQDRARARAGYLAKAKAEADEPQVKEPVRRKGRLLAAGVFAIASILAVAIALRLRGIRDLRFSVGPDGEAGRVGAWIAAPNGISLPLAFSDGSRFSLAPESRARVAGTGASGAHVVLEKGHATVSVVHRPASHWRIDVGPFEVAVVGTRFDVSWEPNEEVFQLKLEQGAVVVSGSFLREPQRLAQGQILRAFCRERREEIVELGGDGQVARHEAADPRRPEAARESIPMGTPETTASIRDEVRSPLQHAPPARQLPSWQNLAAAGEFRKALELVEQRGFAEECRRASGEDLLTLGDTARFAGHPARAREAYLAARVKLPGAGRTAYGLGLLAFDQQRNFVEAARWFDMYLREQPEGGLRCEAQGRSMEAWQRAGEHAKALPMATQYLRDCPRGTQAPLARQLTAH
jgi:hypothetical protein